MMDAALKREIRDTVRSAIEDIKEMYEERWVGGKELGQAITCFSPYWIKTYGHLLPRLAVEVEKEDGTKTRTGYVYPLHKILRMLAEGKLKLLTK